MLVYSARFLVIKKGKIIVGLMQEKANSDSKKFNPTDYCQEKLD